MDNDTFCPLSGLHWLSITEIELALEMYAPEGDQDMDYDEDMYDEEEDSDTDDDDDDDEDEDMDEPNDNDMDIDWNFRAILKRIRPSKKDVKYSRIYAMICAYPPGTNLYPNGGRVEDLLVPGDTPGNYPCPDTINANNIVEVLNLIADNPTGDRDEFFSRDIKDTVSGEAASFMHHTFGTGMVVNYFAYVIFRTACPNIPPHVLFKIYWEKYDAQDEDEDERLAYWGTFRGVDYGPTWGIIGDHVDWCGLGMSRGNDRDQDNDPNLWSTIFDRNKPASQVLDEAWNGAGALWTLVRPNKFPIKKSLSRRALNLSLTAQFTPTQTPNTQPNISNILTSSPIEILLEITSHLQPRHLAPLLSLSKHLRSSLIPHINYLTFQHIQVYQRWLLPAHPIQFNLYDDIRFGREEMNEWCTRWSKVGINPRSPNDIPWYNYARECSKSKSMRNRKRIWGIAKQIEKIAIKKGYIN